jgi:hypothetical protein
MPEEFQPAQAQDDEEFVPTTPWDAMQHPKIARGIENLLNAASDGVKEWTKNEPARVKLQARAVVLSYCFGYLIFASIGFLGWHGILSHETTAAMLSALIGYWYGKKEKEKH